MYPFFDGVDVSNLIQRLNVIEVSGNTDFLSVIPTPVAFVAKQSANTANISNNTVTGAVDLARESVIFQFANTRAQIVLTEKNSTGNTVIYLAELTGYSTNNDTSINLVGTTVTGSRSNASSVVISYQHNSGKLRYYPTTNASSHSANANGIVSNTASFIGPVGTILETDSNTTYGLMLSPDASSVDGWYVGNTITFLGGSIPGETSNITSYNASTKLITVSPKVTGLRNSSNIIYSIGDSRGLYGTSNSIQSHYTSLKGLFGGRLHLPGYGYDQKYEFRVGDRLFRVSDSANNNPSEASTISEYKFASYAMGDSTQTSIGANNQVIISPVSPRSTVYPFKGNSPTAQSFYVDEATYPKGIFVPYVDIFFASKGTQPVELQIRPIVNGYPDSTKIIPNATSIMMPEYVNVSDLPNPNNANTYTRFTFSSPVYLQSGFEFAIVVLTNDLDYELYVSELGGKIIGTDRLVSEQPFLGSLFKSQNSSTYEPIYSEDMMFVIHKCNFVSQGSITFHEEKDRTAQSMTSYTDANLRMDTFTLVSDIIELPDTNIDFRYKSTDWNTHTLDNDFTVVKPDHSVLLDTPKIVYGKYVDNESFITKVDLTTNSPDISPIIYPERMVIVTGATVINNMGLNNFVVQAANTGNGYTLQNTSISITGASGQGANAMMVSVFGDNTSDKIVGAYFDSFGFGYYDNVNITISSTDGTGAVLVADSETNQFGGPAAARYISKTVTLAPEFDAGDLRVYLTAIKPPEANIQVYYKVSNKYDPTPISENRWVRMERRLGTQNDSVNMNPIELEYRPSLTSNNIVYSSNTATFDTFNQFKIKIVMASSATSLLKIPIIYDMRAIALPGDD